MYSFCYLFTSFRLDLNKNIQNDWKLHFSPQLDTHVYPLIRWQKCQNNKGSKKIWGQRGQRDKNPYTPISGPSFLGVKNWKIYCASKSVNLISSYTLSYISYFRWSFDVFLLSSSCSLYCSSSSQSIWLSWCTLVGWQSNILRSPWVLVRVCQWNLNKQWNHGKSE